MNLPKQMFLGTYKTYFSGKNERSSTTYRIILPKKFRNELGNEDKFYIISGPDGEIWGFNIQEWQREAGNRLKIPLTEEEGRMQRRKFFSQADDCLLDSQGRFILPQEFVERANIKKQILLIGAGDHFEIWNTELWQKIINESTQDLTVRVSSLDRHTIDVGKPTTLQSGFYRDKK